MNIRAELDTDHAAVHSLVEEAFAGSDESRLVAGLRDKASPLISLVAEQDAKILGHILFSPATMVSDSSLRLMGLAPMAVLPEHQRSGIGKALVEEGLKRCRQINMGAVIVLGHPEYYPKFGFTPASNFDIKCEYDVPSEAFMLLELEVGYLAGQSGLVKYHEEFSRL